MTNIEQAAQPDGSEPHDALTGLLALRAQSPHQSEMPFALVQGLAITRLPDDLYIPPDALEVFLEAFEGPLDLLLYLIRKQNVDILDIPVAEITRQYIKYVEIMKAVRFELAAEYLVMAAMLGEIKSRMLLPRPKTEDGEEVDPRAELVRRLQEYERFKKAAEDMETLPRLERDIFPARAYRPDFVREKPLPDVDLKEMLLALKEVFQRAEMFEHHHISREKLSTRERMARVLETLQGREFAPFISLFDASEGRLGVVVTFIAILELVKNQLVELVQSEGAFSPIHVRARVTALDESIEVDEYESRISPEEDDA
jgi:segregation and condensation protein A